MHRVLSFQAARGFGESSEFVTKRMCFSFLFSIGFLCLLCGFLIGRFAAHRAVEIRSEREISSMAGNGLETGEQLRMSIIDELGKKEFNTPVAYMRDKDGNLLEDTKEVFSTLNYFSKISMNHSCLMATILGTHENDRHVVLTTGGEANIDIVLEIVRELQKLHLEDDWSPRRTLKFFLYEYSIEQCLESLSDYEKSKIVALVTIDKPVITGSGYFVASGSDMVQSTILELLKDYSQNEGGVYLPRLKIDVPHSVITFVSTANKSSEYVNTEKLIASQRKTLAKILSTSLWKLSQMTIFQWNPQILQETVTKLSANLTASESRPLIHQIRRKVSTISQYGSHINDKIDEIDRFKPLDVRMMNDLLKDIERALLCPDQNYQSRTDFTLIHKPNSSETSQILTDMLACFNTVIKILQDMT